MRRHQIIGNQMRRYLRNLQILVAPILRGSRPVKMIEMILTTILPHSDTNSDRSGKPMTSEVKRTTTDKTVVGLKTSIWATRSRAIPDQALM